MSGQFSVKDMPQHMSLKFREVIFLLVAVLHSFQLLTRWNFFKTLKCGFLPTMYFYNKPIINVPGAFSYVYVQTVMSFSGCANARLPVEARTPCR